LVMKDVVLRDTVEFLTERLACAERRLKAANLRMPYSPSERLHMLWCVEYFSRPWGGWMGSLAHGPRKMQHVSRRTTANP
jgi:hypothetical protein